MTSLEQNGNRIDGILVAVASIVLCYITYWAVFAAYDVFFGPLSKFPGRKTWAASYLPLIRTLSIGDFHTSMRAQHDKHGPVVRISPKALSFNTAQAWQDIYGHPKGGKPDLAKDSTFYITPVNGVHDIVSADDVSHRRMRKLLSPAFSEKALKEQQPILKRYVSLMILKLKERADAGEPVDLTAYFNYTTFDIMGDLTFSESLHMLESMEYHPWVKLTFGSLKSLTITSALRMIPGLENIITMAVSRLAGKTLHDHAKFSADRVDRRLAKNTDRPDFWSYILKRQGEHGLSLGEMHSNSSTFMIAGTETSATLLSGLTYQLLQHPAAMQKLIQEIRSSFKSDDDISINALRRMPYLYACIEEGMRIFPPVPTGMPRVTPKGGAFIDGQWVSGGVSVSVNQWATYHSSKNFALPDEFSPERWLDGNDSRFALDNRAALQPFSVGPRDCIGRNLAYHETRLIISEVLFHFDLELDERSFNWSTQKTYRLWDKPPLWVKLSPRRD